MTDLEIDSKLTTLKSLFSHLKNKDVFLNQSRTLLSSRLLMKTSLNTEMEKVFISKLKLEVGYNSVRKMETMFKDMDIS